MKKKLHTIKILILLFSFTLNAFAQMEEKEQPFFKYFLWYNGTIGDKPVKAKVAINNGEYDVYYAYNDKKQWIHLLNNKVLFNTIYAKADTDQNSFDGLIKLKMDNLTALIGEWTSPTGNKLPIELKSDLKRFQPLGTENQFKNELTPLLLQLDVVTDSINVYNTEFPILYTKANKTEETQIVYVDINFDEYLDIIINESIYLYHPRKQKFKRVDKGIADNFHFIQNLESYNLFDKEIHGFRVDTDSANFKLYNGRVLPNKQEELITDDISIPEGTKFILDVVVVDVIDKNTRIEVYINDQHVYHPKTPINEVSILDNSLFFPTNENQLVIKVLNTENMSDDFAVDIKLICSKADVLDKKKNNITKNNRTVFEKKITKKEIETIAGNYTKKWPLKLKR